MGGERGDMGTGRVRGVLSKRRRESPGREAGKPEAWQRGLTFLVGHPTRRIRQHGSEYRAKTIGVEAVFRRRRILLGIRHLWELFKRSWREAQEEPPPSPKDKRLQLLR